MFPSMQVIIITERNIGVMDAGCRLSCKTARHVVVVIVEDDTFIVRVKNTQMSGGFSEHAGVHVGWSIFGVLLLTRGQVTSSQLI